MGNSAVFGESLLSLDAVAGNVEHLRLEESPAGFIPAARLQLTPIARTGGLLRELSGNQARILLALFSYLTPNGYLFATADQIAEALGIPSAAANLWLWRFSRM